VISSSVQALLSDSSCVCWMNIPVPTPGQGHEMSMIATDWTRLNTQALLL
jgi:hypothetical protein